jgi:UDP-N-acetylmuramate--alanine ligase
MYNPKLHFHFIGIGGSGMSGIAEILLNSGFLVSGSDIKCSEVTKRLEGFGATIALGHKASNVPSSASLVVYSSAVNGNNPEMREAKKRGLPVVRRAEVLAELMRLKFGVGVAGSHGKTTTTSMCGVILDAAKLDPTVVIGGQVASMGTGGRLGRGEYLVAETDESDRSFLLLKPTVAIVTNIDDEHMNAYRSRKDLEDSFKRFVEAVPFYGLAVLCVDDPVVREIADGVTRRVVRYGFNEGAEITARDIQATPEGMRYTVLVRGESIGRFFLPMLGRHLVLNSLAAIAVALEFGIEPEVIRGALSSFGGVKRRLEVIGRRRGITVMNDYGHHPTEVRATLKAIRECLADTMRRFVVVFQPHRYSRTKLCWDEFLTSFSDCDELIVSDVYAASEEEIVGISGESLCSAIHHQAKRYAPKLEEIPGALAGSLADGDVVLCLGAGSVGALPEKILSILGDEGTASLSDYALTGDHPVKDGATKVTPEILPSLSETSSSSDGAACDTVLEENVSARIPVTMPPSALPH